MVSASILYGIVLLSVIFATLLLFKKITRNSKSYTTLQLAGIVSVVAILITIVAIWINLPNVATLISYALAFATIAILLFLSLIWRSPLAVLILVPAILWVCFWVVVIAGITFYGGYHINIG